MERSQNQRMKAMKPCAAFAAPDTLTGDGLVPADLTFGSMDDFSPAAVAARVEGRRPLLDARRQLGNLLSYMDGKEGAEALIARVLRDPALLQTLADTPKAQA